MPITTNDGQVFEDELDFHLNNPMDQGKTDTRSPKVPLGPLPSYEDKEPQSQNKQLYFVRHGDTDLNEESGEKSHDQPIRGWSQVSLNDDGRKEAQRAAESVKDLGITHIVSSDLPRAAETAQIIGDKIGITPELNPGLRTWDLGGYTEQKGKEVHDAVDRLCTEAQDERPPSGEHQGESFNEFKDRILGTVSDIAQQHPDDHKVLVVSHNSPERIIHAWTEAGQPQKKQQDFIGSILDFFRGSKQSSKEYPTDKESDLSRDTDLSYGDPAARYVNPGIASTKDLPFDFAKEILNADLPPNKEKQLMDKYSKNTPVSLERADEFNKAWLAARRSPVAQLGFDLSKLYQSRDVGKSTVGGQTNPGSDTIWQNAYYNTTLIHEAMHRGMDILNKQNLLPKNIATDEMMVRALMRRHFGNVEETTGEGSKQQSIQSTYVTNKEMLDDLEKAAADYIAKKKPGGPR